MIPVTDKETKLPEIATFTLVTSKLGIESCLNQLQEPSSDVLLCLVEGPCQELGLCSWADLPA